MNIENLHAFYHQVFRHVANLLGVHNYEWMSSSELAGAIDRADSQAFQRLMDFIKAYNAWYEVHVRIEEAGTAGHLSNREDAELNKAINDRDFTRDALIKHLTKP